MGKWVQQEEYVEAGLMDINEEARAMLPTTTVRKPTFWPEGLVISTDKARSGLIEDVFPCLAQSPSKIH